jgi:hypothetical protein
MVTWSLVMQNNSKPKSDLDDEWDSHVLSMNGFA